MPRLISHLEKKHPDIVLPAKIVYNRALKEKQVEEPATQPSKRPREDSVDDRVARLFARKLYPFSDVEDVFYKELGSTLNRKNIADKMAAIAMVERSLFLKSCEKAHCAFAIDSGTNAGTRTLNVCVLSKGRSRLLEAIRIPVQSSAAIADCVGLAVKPFADAGCPVLFVSDNAMNVRVACMMLAETFHGICAGCACHATDKIFRKILLETKDVKEALAIVQGIPSTVSFRIPRDVETRWIGCYDALAAVAAHKLELVFEDNHLTVSAYEKVVKAKAILTPAFAASCLLEKDTSNIFVAAQMYGTVFVDMSFAQTFVELFSRNAYSVALVAACGLSPNLLPDTLIKPLRMMICDCVGTLLRQMGLFAPCVENELLVLMSGGPHRTFRASNSSPLHFWAAGETPTLHELFIALRNLPASSACVERSFSKHARLHTDARTTLAEESVSAQLSLNSFITQSTLITEMSDEYPTHVVCERVLEWCFPEWTGERAERLKEGDTVLVWFDVQGKLTAYKAKLLTMDVANVWTVRWTKDATSNQTFNSRTDYWLWIEEMDG